MKKQKTSIKISVLDKFKKALNKTIKEENNAHIESITFTRFYNEQFKPLYLEKLKVTTKKNYYTVEKTFLNSLGEMQLQDIKPIHIEMYFNEEEQAGRKRAGIKFQCLKSIFARAVEWDVIEKNPTKNIKPKKSQKQKREIHYYTKEQLNELFTLLNTKAGEKLSIQVKLAALCGLRIGEIAALTAEDINVKKRTISINKNLQRDYTSGKNVLYNPKTGKDRIVIIPVQIVDELQNYIASVNKLTAGPLWQESEFDGKRVTFLFTDKFGNLNRTDTIRHAWREFLKRTQFTYLNFHGLRHTCATLLIQNGANINAVQELLGHTDVSTTINRYTHTEVNDIRKAVQLFDDIISK